MHAPSTRTPAVAGTFYPADPTTLESDLRRYLETAGAGQANVADGPWPKAIIAPHAGYVYSGPVAASAYTHIRAARGTVSRVVLLGPCHRVAVRGLALSGADWFETPLGRIQVDKAAEALIADLPQVQTIGATHRDEHSLEVHLPFLQVVLGDFKLVPVVVGQARTDDVAQVLDRLWGGRETLIVISSDLSHFLPYDQARDIDAKTRRAIETMTVDAVGDSQACGRIPVKGLLRVARTKGMRVTTVDVRNSGDTAGNKDQVVGYGSWLFMETDAKAGTAPQAAPSRDDNFEHQTRALLDTHGKTLINLAVRSIAHGFDHGTAWNPATDDCAAELLQHMACFITLTHKGKLRGCVGSLEAHRPLLIDVAENAFMAAFRDTRFAPLSWADTAELDLSISVLSPAVNMNVRDENDLLDQLRPGLDGLIIRDQGRRALFLPQVWESLPKRRDFVEQLKIKGGFSRDHWSETFQAERFISQSVAAPDLFDDPNSLWNPYRNP